MTEITLKIPGEIKKLVDDLQEPIYIEAIREVASKKLAEKRKKLIDFQKKIKKFEDKYSTFYDEFCKNVPADRIGHEDWIEWTYLVEVQAELHSSIQKLEMLLPQ